MRPRFFICALLTIIIGLAACSSTAVYPTVTRSQPPVLPDYPNKQREEQQAVAGITGFDVQIITFQTSDPPTSVLEFYKNRLLQEGWSDPIQTNQESLSLVNLEACPLFGLYVRIMMANTKMTEVELRLVPQPCGAL